jgi:tryptophan synthase alpha chain
MNRIEKKFDELRRNGSKAFISFVTAGDPDLRTTHDLVLEFEGVGVDIVELGVPFSDPLADGPTIQRASARALHNGVSLSQTLRTVERIRSKVQIPIALMTYYNPVFKYGIRKFVSDAARCGADGVIIPDLPPEEDAKIIECARESGFCTVFFIAPTTTQQRAKWVAQKSTGFIYYVTLTGVTGARARLPEDIVSRIQILKRITTKPIAAGFGASTPAQVKEIANVADGVIVGSAIIDVIEKNVGRKDMVHKVGRFVGELADAAHRTQR